MGHWINWFSEIKHFVPWMSLLAGIGGSIHCAGMCGGLVTASCQNTHEVFRYQLGRLLGYLLLGLAFSTIGQLFQFSFINTYFSLLPSLFIGALFIYWGLQNFRGKKAELPIPPFLRTAYQKLWRKLGTSSSTAFRSFFTGLISILLPCGLLYGVILGAVALQDWKSAVLSIFFFWLGTLPSMILAPSIFQKIIQPLKKSRPKISATCLMLIGVMTISFRLYREFEMKKDSTTNGPHHSCH